jgi:hypothetical protein
MDNGTLTHNVNTEWIRDWDPKGATSEESYLIEWRVPPKPRDGKWPLYDGRVLDFSGKLLPQSKIKNRVDFEVDSTSTPFSIFDWVVPYLHVIIISLLASSHVKPSHTMQKLLGSAKLHSSP